MSNKTYEKAFMGEMKAFDQFNIKPSYSKDKVPTMDALEERMHGKQGVLHELVASFKEQGEIVGNDLLHRAVMSPVWRDLGRPVFNITPELAAALIMTDLPSKIDVKPPFPAFMLSIQVPLDGPTPLVVDGSNYFGLAFLNTDMRPGQSWAVWAFPKWEPQQSHYQKVPNPELLHEWVKRYPDSIHVHRLLINFFAYVNAKKATGDLPKAKKAKLGTRKGMSVTSLGKDVKLPHNLIYAARGEASADPQYKLSKRFVVRGHFRNQQYGPRSNPKHRVTWIQPFWKGPDVLEASERIYTVS